MCDHADLPKVVHLEATIMRQTRESLERAEEQTGLTVGEVIDRLALQMKPTDPQIAAELAAQEVAIILSGVPEDQRIDAMREMLTSMTALLPPNVVDEIHAAAKELQAPFLAGRFEELRGDD